MCIRGLWGRVYFFSILDEGASGEFVFCICCFVFYYVKVIIFVKIGYRVFLGFERIEIDKKYLFVNMLGFFLIFSCFILRFGNIFGFF